MSLRTTSKWKSLPGSFDKQNTENLFQSSNEWGIPDLCKDLFVPEWLVPVKQRMRVAGQDLTKGAMHFFVDDYHFETMWSRPLDTLSIVDRTGKALTPDFSLYTDYPKAMQIWNVYRNRWCGRYWQSKGIEVIPSIAWAGKESYDFCFAGVEKGSTVAISTVGVNRGKEVVQLFVAGFEEMLKQIEPELVLVYGETAPIKLEEYCSVKWYPSYWKTMRDIVSKKKKEQERGEVHE